MTPRDALLDWLESSIKAAIGHGNVPLPLVTHTRREPGRLVVRADGADWRLAVGRSTDGPLGVTFPLDMASMRPGDLKVTRVEISEDMDVRAIDVEADGGDVWARIYDMPRARWLCDWRPVMDLQFADGPAGYGLMPGGTVLAVEFHNRGETPADVRLEIHGVRFVTHPRAPKPDLRALLARALEHVKATEWDTRNAAENNVCSIYCGTDEEKAKYRYKDQPEHFAGCKWVALVRDLEEGLK